MRATALFTLVPALALVAGCAKSGGDDATEKTPPPTIRAATVVAAEAPTPDVLTLTGMITADQRSDVTADTQGKVINVMIERGQRVKLGQPVVQLDVRTAALSAREARASLAVGSGVEAARRSGVRADQAAARQGRDHAVRVRPPEHAVLERGRAGRRRRRRAPR